jgi:hypothetical protein
MDGEVAAEDRTIIDTAGKCKPARWQAAGRAGHRMQAIAVAPAPSARDTVSGFAVDITLDWLPP